jgi:DNA gyrase inhibitor GyrI
MSELHVRIKKLKPMRVASVRVISPSPELEAWTKIKTWAAPKGLLDSLHSHPVFGYTSQPPRPGESHYGYEFWIAIDPDTDVEGDVREQAFAGGNYAVLSVDGPPTPETWKALWDWVQASPYKWRKTHELESPRNPLAPEAEWVFDLYLPIEAKD